MQWSNKFKSLDEKKLLKKQNEMRNKYGLKSRKRLQAEMVLYLLIDNNDIQREHITLHDGGMYQ